MSLQFIDLRMPASQNDQTHLGLRQAVSVSEAFLSPSTCSVESFQLPGLGVGNLCSPIQFSAFQCAASLSHHISEVDSRCTQEEVQRVDARRIVAGVTDLMITGVLSVKDPVRQPVCAVCDAGERQTTVPILVSTARPFPAFIQSVQRHVSFESPAQTALSGSSHSAILLDQGATN